MTNESLIQLAKPKTRHPVNGIDRSKKAKIYFACLNHPMFAMLPYTWGLLRAFAETSELVKKSYDFVDAFYGRPKVDEMMAKIEAPAIFGTKHGGITKRTWSTYCAKDDVFRRRVGTHNWIEYDDAQRLDRL